MWKAEKIHIALQTVHRLIRKNEVQPTSLQSSVVLHPENSPEIAPQAVFYLFLLLIHVVLVDRASQFELRSSLQSFQMTKIVSKVMKLISFKLIKNGYMFLS